MCVHVSSMFNKAGTAVGKKCRKKHLNTQKKNKRKGLPQSQGFRSVPRDSIIKMGQKKDQLFQNFFKPCWSLWSLFNGYLVLWKAMFHLWLLAPRGTLVFLPISIRPQRLNSAPRSQLVLVLQARCCPLLGPRYRFLAWSSADCWENALSRNPRSRCS